MDSKQQVIDRIVVSRRESASLIDENEVKLIKQFLIASKPVISSVSSQLIVSLFPLLKDKLISTTGLDDPRVLICDTMSIWFLRASQIDDMALAHSVTTNDDLTSIFHYIPDFLQNGVGPLSNSLTSLLSKLVLYAKSFPNHLSLLHCWMDHCLKLSFSSRNTYLLIDTLAKELPSSQYVLDVFPQFPTKCMENMWSNALANSASKAFATIFQNLHSVESSIDSWYDIVHSALMDLDRRKNIFIYLLPLLFKAAPEDYSKFIHKLQFRSTQLSGTDVELAIGILNIGMDLALISNPFDPKIPSDQVVISQEYLNNLLTHHNENLRLMALSLLFKTNKNTESIPSYIYDIVLDKSLVQIYLKESDSIESRSEFITIFRQFLIRVRDSTFSLDRELKKLVKNSEDNEAKIAEKESNIEAGKVFLQRIISIITDSTKPGSSYCQITLGLKLVEILIENQLDGIDRSCNKNVTSKSQRKQQNSKSKFPFEVSIFSNELVQQLFNLMTNNYEDIRDQSLKILLDSPLDRIQLAMAHREELVHRATELLYDLKGRKSEGGAKVFQFLCQFYDSTSDNLSVFELFNYLISKLDEGVQGLNLNAALLKQQRVHGILTAIRLILENVNMFRVYLDLDKSIQVTYLDLIKRISTIWNQVKPILLERSDGDFEDGSQSDDELIFCFIWKVVKESSSLINAIINLIYTTEDSPVSFLTPAFIEISTVVMDQLASVKHRGAFSSVYPTFILICEICFKNESLRDFPLQWLLQSIQQIETKNQLISRRSGGLPFLFTGILTGEKIVKSQKLIKLSFEELLRIARTEYIPNADEKNDIPQVHAFNCIKHIFIDSQLSEVSYSYVNDALQLSLTNFNNRTWAIRNCAVMLFTALQNRIFGTNKLGYTSARLFFSKFPGVSQLLFELLVDAARESEDTGTTNSNKIEVIFPILTIISRLNCVDEDNSQLEKFETALLNYCLNNRYWKVREMAARLLASILNVSSLIPMVESLLDDIEDPTSRDLNRIHGNLMAILEIARRVKRENSDSKSLAYIQQLLLNKVALFLSDSPKFTFVTAKVFVDILELTNVKNIPEAIFESLLVEFTRHLTDGNKGKLNGARLLYLSTLLSLCLQLLASQPSTLIRTISEPLRYAEFEIQLEIIRFCIDNFENLKYEPSIESLFSDLWTIICDKSSWTYVTEHALELLGKLVEFKPSLCGNDEKKMEYISILFDLTTQHSDDVIVLALDVLGLIISVLNSQPESKYLHSFILLCQKYTSDDTPFSIRYAANHALLQFVSQSSGFNSYMASAVCTMHSSLSDDDTEIRQLVAKYSGRIFKCQDENALVLVSETYLSRAVQMFDISILESALVNYFVNTTPTVSERINEISHVDDNLLFEAESLNLYRDNISVREQIIDGIIQLNNLSKLKKSSIDKLEHKVVSDIDLITQKVTQSGRDGVFGWSRDSFAFTSLTESILGARLLLLIAPNDSIQQNLDYILHEVDNLNLFVPGIAHT